MQIKVVIQYKIPQVYIVLRIHRLPTGTSSFQKEKLIAKSDKASKKNAKNQRPRDPNTTKIFSQIELGTIFFSI